MSAATSGNAAPVAPDLSFVPPFLDAVFRYASPDAFFALRVFRHERDQPPPWSVDIRFGDPALPDAIARGARYAATASDPCVFSPAMCAMARPGTAKGRDIAEGIALVVELDEGDTEAALARLEGLIGTPTVVNLSGGEWINPTTGELHPKRHAYWRLSEPTRDEAEHVLLYAARRDAARLIGADPTGKPIVHCYRMPGSVHRKNLDRPVLCVIERINPDAEVHLIDAADTLAEAVEGAGLNGGGGRHKGNGSTYRGRRELQADPALVAAAMAFVPNADVHYADWVRTAYAIAGATGGTGYDVFQAWSAKSAKHDDGETETVWNRVLAAGPTHIGAGSIFHEAKLHGWVDPRLRKSKSAKTEKTTASNCQPSSLGLRRGTSQTPPPTGPGTGDGSGDEEEPEESEGEGEETEGDGEPEPDETPENETKPDHNEAGADDGKDEPRPDGTDEDTKPKPLTEAERDALFEHAADLDDEDYELERADIAEQLSRGRKEKFRGTTLNKIRDRIRKARAGAKAAQAAAEAAAAAAARKGQPPPPPPPDTPEVKALLAEFNAKYFVVDEHGKGVIYSPKHDPDQNRNFYERITRADLEMLYLNRTVLAGYSEATDEPIYKPAAYVWLHHPKRQQYIGGIVFDPSTRVYPDDVLNLWKGFSVTAKPGSWDKLASHIETVICNNDPDHFYYLMDWMADLVQHPEKQGEVAVVLCGIEGSGKGILARALKHLLGQHGFAISNAKHLTGNFNAHLRDCVFLFSDEALFAGNPAHVPVLKSIITEPYLTIEGKYQNAVMAANRLHIMLATNEPWAVPASPDSRRYYVLNVSPDRANDHAYFKAIQDELENGGYEAMLHELRHRDISASNLRDVPVTTALVTQRMKSLDTAHAWWLDCLMRGYVFASTLGLEDRFAQWLDPISTELLYASYLKFCTHRERRPLNRIHFGRWLNETAGCKPYRAAAGTRMMVGEHITDATTTGSNYSSRVAEPVWQDRPHSYRLGNLAEARDAFIKATKLVIEWPDDDPGTP